MNIDWLIGVFTGLTFGAGTTLLIIRFTLLKEGEKDEKTRLLQNDVSQGTTKNMQTK